MTGCKYVFFGDAPLPERSCSPKPADLRPLRTLPLYYILIFGQTILPGDSKNSLRLIYFRSTQILAINFPWVAGTRVRISCKAKYIAIYRDSDLLTVTMPLNYCRFYRVYDYKKNQSRNFKNPNHEDDAIYEEDADFEDYCRDEANEEMEDRWGKNWRKRAGAAEREKGVVIKFKCKVIGNASADVEGAVRIAHGFAEQVVEESSLLIRKEERPHQAPLHPFIDAAEARIMTNYRHRGRQQNRRFCAPQRELLLPTIQQKAAYNSYQAAQKRHADMIKLGNEKARQWTQNQEALHLCSDKRIISTKAIHPKGKRYPVAVGMGFGNSKPHERVIEHQYDTDSASYTDMDNYMAAEFNIYQPSERFGSGSQADTNSSFTADIEEYSNMVINKLFSAPPNKTAVLSSKPSLTSLKALIKSTSAPSIKSTSSHISSTIRSYTPPLLPTSSETIFVSSPTTSSYPSSQDHLYSNSPKKAKEIEYHDAAIPDYTTKTPQEYVKSATPPPNSTTEFPTFTKSSKNTKELVYRNFTYPITVNAATSFKESYEVGLRDGCSPEVIKEYNKSTTPLLVTVPQFPPSTKSQCNMCNPDIKIPGCSKSDNIITNSNINIDSNKQTNDWSSDTMNFNDLLVSPTDTSQISWPSPKTGMLIDFSDPTQAPKVAKKENTEEKKIARGQRAGSTGTCYELPFEREDRERREARRQAAAKGKNL